MLLYIEVRPHQDGVIQSIKQLLFTDLGFSDDKALNVISLIE